MGAAAFALLPALNALSTGQGLNASVPAGDWAMAGFDLTALACGVFLAWAASRMLRPAKPASQRAAKAAKVSPAMVEVK